MITFLIKKVFFFFLNLGGFSLSWQGLILAAEMTTVASRFDPLQPVDRHGSCYLVWDFAFWLAFKCFFVYHNVKKKPQNTELGLQRPHQPIIQQVSPSKIAQSGAFEDGFWSLLVEQEVAFSQKMEKNLFFIIVDSLLLPNRCQISREHAANMREVEVFTCARKRFGTVLLSLNNTFRITIKYVLRLRTNQRVWKRCLVAWTIHVNHIWIITQ